MKLTFLNRIPPARLESVMISKCLAMVPPLEEMSAANSGDGTGLSSEGVVLDSIVYYPSASEIQLSGSQSSQLQDAVDPDQASGRSDNVV